MNFHPDLLKTVDGLRKNVLLRPASEAPVYGRITSGSLALDVVLGGGWPTGAWSEIIGDPSNGKTFVCLKTIAANQVKDPEFTTVWVAAENWDKDWAAKCGVDNDRVLLVETNVMEDAYKSVIELCQTHKVDLVVIDSLPVLEPSTEGSREIGEMLPGRKAMLTNQFFRRMQTIHLDDTEGDDRQAACILINQWRFKIGVMMGDPRTTPGGEGKNYAMAVKCEIKRDEWREVGTGTAKRRIGMGVKVHTNKNKTAPPQQTAYFDMYMADGGPVDAGEIDFAKETVSLAIIYGVVERRGAWFYYTETKPDGTPDARKWNGAPALADSVREEPLLRDQIEREVFEILGIDVR